MLSFRRQKLCFSWVISGKVHSNLVGCRFYCFSIVTVLAEGHRTCFAIVSEEHHTCFGMGCFLQVYCTGLSLKLLIGFEGFGFFHTIWVEEEGEVAGCID